MNKLRLIYKISRLPDLLVLDSFSCRPLYIIPESVVLAKNIVNQLNRHKSPRLFHAVLIKLIHIDTVVNARYVLASLNADCFYLLV